MLHVENMKADDFPFAAEIANTMGWNMTKDDFELSLKLEPKGCLVLLDKAERIGIATCVSFGKVGWFGNLIVDEAHRKRNGGTMLLQKAIDYLRSRGVETIGLYAYQHLIKFYEKVGFKLKEEFSIFQGKATTSRAHNRFEKITKSDVAAVLELDKECFGGDRKRLLEPIILDENNHCYLLRQNDQIAGYITTKRYDETTEVGPMSIREGRNALASSLLKTVLGNSLGQEMFVCLPTHNKALVEVLIEAGLEESFRVTRMFLGPAVAESCTYIAESLERG